MRASIGDRSQKSKTKNLKTTFIAIGLLLAIAVVLIFVFQNPIKQSTSDDAATVESRDRPKFVFNTTEFPDWASSGNTWPTDGTGGEQNSSQPSLISVIGVTQCTPGSNCSKLVDECKKSRGEKCHDLDKYTKKGCDVSAYYSTGTIDPDIAIKNELDRSSGFGLEPKKLGTKKLSMNTPEGNKQYVLYLYDTNNPDDSYKKGSAFGFITLKDSHIEVRSTCWQANQIDETIAVLMAVGLEE